MNAGVRRQLLSNPCIHREFGDVLVKSIKRPCLVDDATSVFELKNHDAHLRAVLLLSSEKTPARVQESVIRAEQARSSTARVTGDHILMPLSEGMLDGRSYAVFPFCKRISNFGFLNKLQRLMLKKAVLDWLYAFNRETVHACEADDIDARFAHPLRRLLDEPGIPHRLVQDADNALRRLAEGAWTPFHVTMHGDFWHGNILIGAAPRDTKAPAWRKRFVIIDWAGSRTDAYPIFDLMRIAHSFNLKSVDVSPEVKRHCALLGCEPIDARSYNAAALGHMLINLENFPFPRFVQMATTCVDILDRTLPEQRV